MPIKFLILGYFGFFFEGGEVSILFYGRGDFSEYGLGEGLIEHLPFCLLKFTLAAKNELKRGNSSNSCYVYLSLSFYLGIRKGGGKTYRAILGGGGKRTIKHLLKNQLWRPQKVGFLWSVSVSSKENDIA